MIVRSRLILLILTLLLPCPSGSSSVVDRDPRSTVERYCALDSQGANFTASNPGSKEIRELLTDEDEAGYDSSVIVLSCATGRIAVNKASADIEVKYVRVGTLSGELEAKGDRQLETVMFHLSKEKGSWKIDGLRMPPHISKSWIISHLRENLGKVRHAGKNDPHLEAAIAEISRW